MNSAIAYSEDTDSIVESLLKTNEPPPDDVRPRLVATLKTLQDAFQRIAGRPFTAGLEGQEETLPEEVKAYGHSIQQYASVLSSKRCFPIELWQCIFESGLSGWDEYYLQTLCSVCKDWRTAAISHYHLWARLPRITSLKSLDDPTIEVFEILTQRYLLL